MKIAMLAPIWERVPPGAYGGIELIVSLLCEHLIARGHTLTLFASGDSCTGAELAWSEPHPLRAQNLPWYECQPREILHVGQCFRRAAEFDLIHNHAGYLPMIYARSVSTPVLTTLHGPFNDHNRALFELFADQPYVSISDAQRQGAPDGLNFVATVYNGIDTANFAPMPKRGYLLHLGRVSPEKGSHLAIAAARAAERPLVIAGKVDPVDQAYFDEMVAPHLDGEQISFIGEVGGRRKFELLAGADALLHLVQWPEPFGLVMAEALAAGTPVIAFPLGAIPEVVEDGLTGFVVASLAEAIDAIGRLDTIDPAVCRRQACARFDAGRMAADYLEVYEALLSPAVTLERMGERSARDA